MEGQTIFSSEELLKSAGWKRPIAFSDEAVKSGIQKILNLYENSGYPYAQVTIDDFALDNNLGVKVWLRIVEGPLVRVSQIEWAGISPGVAGVLEKEINFKPGEEYSARIWQERIKTLRNLAYLKQVNDPELQLDADYEGRVRITVIHLSNSIAGALGYVPASSKRIGYLTGNIALQLSNFLDGPREAQIDWSKKDLSSYYLNFAFREYWLFRTPLSVGLNFQQRQTDSSYSKIAVEEQTSYRLSNNLTISSLLSWERVYQKDYFKNIFPSSQKLGLGMKLNWSRLNYRYNPRKGTELEAQAKFVNWEKNSADTLLTSPAKDKIWERQVTIWNYFPLWHKQTLALKLAYLELSSSEDILSPADLYKLGGIGTLRGYYPEQFWARQLFLTTGEYRFLLSEEVRLYLFLDMAKFKRQTLQENRLTGSSSFKLGYGAGLWLDSKIGLVGLDLGLGQKDQLQDLKIHLSLKNRF